MAYDGLGNRAQLVGWVSGVPYTTTYATRIVGQVQILQAGSGGITTTYWYGVGSIGEFGSSTSYYLVDGNGSVRQVTDQNGSVTVARWYDPFGQIITQNGTGDTLYGYLGGQFDKVIGLMYIDGRYYDPITGRFLTPSTGGQNPYVPLASLSLAPFILIAVLRRRKKGQIWTGWLVLAVMATVGLGLAACGNETPPQPQNPPTPRPITTPPTSAPILTPSATPTPPSASPLPPTPPQCPTPTSPLTPTPTPTPTNPTNISQEGVEFIARFEGVELELYNDPSGNCTIGAGHLVHLGACDGRDSEAEFANSITEQQADNLLAEDLDDAEQTVNDQVIVPLTQSQYDALVSFTYQAGIGNFAGSSLLTRLNAGEYDAIPDELDRWVYGSDGTLLQGLQTRRDQEGDLFSNGVYGAGP